MAKRENMPNSNNNTGWFQSHNLWWLLLAAIAVVIDQITKYIALDKLVYEGNSVPVLPVFSWTLAYNPGAAFSFLSDAGGWQKYFFVGLVSLSSV